jgi:hypothetical protein
VYLVAYEIQASLILRHDSEATHPVTIEAISIQPVNFKFMSLQDRPTTYCRHLAKRENQFNCSQGSDRSCGLLVLDNDFRLVYILRR